MKSEEEEEVRGQTGSECAEFNQRNEQNGLTKESTFMATKEEKKRGRVKGGAC